MILRLTLMLATAATIARADDWPQWRGPNRTDVSNEAGLLQEWPTDGPKRLWLYDKAGLGYAGFAVVGDRLYSMGLEDGEAFTFCLNVESGKKIWQTAVAGQYENRWGDGPRSTPTVDGDYVYCMFAQGTVACMNTADGKIVWQSSMKDVGGKQPYWGFTESVLVDGDKVICTPGGKQGTILALNKKTGQKIWQSSDVTVPCHYSSPVKATIHGQPQYVQLTMTKLFGVSADDGKLLWESEWPGRTAVIPTPIVKGNAVYIATGYGVGSKLVEIKADGSATDVWNNKVMKNHHGGVIELNGHCYGYSDGLGWICQSLKDGEPVWSEKRKLGKGAIAYADGRFYLLDERRGTVALVAASSEGWEEHGRFTLSPQTERRKPSGRIWVHPVISNGKLYLRDQEYVYCYDVKR